VPEGEARAEMGRATFGGMFASTLITLFIALVAYSLLDDVQERVKILFKRRVDSQ
jgi:multidrug efflux pump subunit AcrB